MCNIGRGFFSLDILMLKITILYLFEAPGCSPLGEWAVEARQSLLVPDGVYSDQHWKWNGRPYIMELWLILTGGQQDSRWEVIWSRMNACGWGGFGCVCVCMHACSSARKWFAHQSVQVSFIDVLTLREVNMNMKSWWGRSHGLPITSPPPSVALVCPTPIILSPPHTLPSAVLPTCLLTGAHTNTCTQALASSTLHCERCGSVGGHQGVGADVVTGSNVKCRKGHCAESQG